MLARIEHPGHLALLAVSLWLMGCSPDDQTPATTTVRDSAGITIVSSDRPAWGGAPHWTLDTIPYVDMGGSDADEDHTFFQVSGAATLPGDRIAVADAGSSIRFFGDDGSLIRTVGRSGEGPGEFRRLMDLSRYRGDSVVVLDNSLDRVTFVDVSTGLWRSIQVPALIHVHPLADSVLLGTVSVPDAAVAEEEKREGLFRPLAPILAISPPTGRILDTMAVEPGYEVYLWHDGQIGVRPFFGHGLHVATHDDRVFVGTADQMQFRVLDRAGSLRRIVRIPGYDLALPSGAVEAERDLRLAHDPPPIVRQSLERLPDPTRRPAYSSLLVGPDGYVFLAGYHELSHRDAPVDWQVFAPDGAWLGALRTPARFTAMEFGRDYVLGVRRDELDREHVQLLHLTRGPDGPSG